MKTDIEQAGAQLVYIAAEKSTGVWKPAKFLQSHPVSYPFLLDEDRLVTKAYGLYHGLGIDAINIAHPGSSLATGKSSTSIAGPARRIGRPSIRS